MLVITNICTIIKNDNIIILYFILLNKIDHFSTNFFADSGVMVQKYMNIQGTDV